MRAPAGERIADWAPALRDADTLRACLAGAGTVLERVGRYEARMRDYANAALAVSTRNARRAWACPYDRAGRHREKKMKCVGRTAL